MAEIRRLRENDKESVAVWEKPARGQTRTHPPTHPRTHVLHDLGELFFGTPGLADTETIMRRERSKVFFSKTIGGCSSLFNIRQQT